MEFKQFGVIFAFIFSILWQKIYSQQNILEKTVQDCRSKVDDIDVCIKDFLEYIKPRFKENIPEIGMPPLDPFNLGTFDFQRNDGVINLKAVFSNVKAAGYSGVTFRKIKSDLVKRKLVIQSRIPNLQVTGQYTLQGTILGNPLNGNGDFSLSFDGSFQELKGDIIINGTGGEHLSMTNTKITMQFGNVKVNLENLFNGDPILGRTVNHFLNENSHLIINEVDTEVNVRLSEFFEPVINKIVALFPISIIQ